MGGDGCSLLSLLTVGKAKPYPWSALRPVSYTASRVLLRYRGYLLPGTAHVSTPGITWKGYLKVTLGRLVVFLGHAPGRSIRYGIGTAQGPPWPG